MKVPLLFLVVPILLLICLATGLSAADLEVGKPFPILEFPSLEDGKPLSVADFRGRKLILHNWASW